MRTSLKFSFILVFVFLTVAVGMSWVSAQNKDSINIERLTQTNQYLPVVLWNDADRAALVALYKSTNGADWLNSTGWLGSDDHCGWYGIICVNGRVTYIYLAGNQLDGTIPTELRYLGNLKFLDLNLNQLYGHIPKELGYPSKLVALDLRGNQLTGPIPKELGNLSNLMFLQLEDNQLSGPIPRELGDLSNLTDLDLSENQLVGSVPKELGNLGKLVNLQLMANQLSCWETSGVLEWAQSINVHAWDDPPGTTICP